MNSSDIGGVWQGLGPGRLLLLAVLFAVIAFLAGFDLVTDVGEGASVLHMVTEGFVVAIGLVGLAVMTHSLALSTTNAKRLRKEAESLATKLEAKGDETRVLAAKLAKKTEEAERWHDEAKVMIDGLGEAIDRQFERWELTNAEKEVALLLLKGLSHKEIAQIRGTSDATNRQQARAIYRKGELSGRNDLTAFFLEDLLLPFDDG